MSPQLTIALERHRSGHLAEAARDYRAILLDRPDHADATHLLGVVALQQGDPARAADLIGRAIAVEPRQATYHANLAEARRALGRLDGAVAAGRAALRLRPDFPEAANGLGLALLAQGQADAAIEQFETALRLRPDFAPAHNNLGNARLARKDKDGALAAFRRAVALDPDLAEARSNLGQLLTERGEAAEALPHCEAAVRLRPDFAAAISNLGNALRGLNRLDEAMGRYAEALRLGPGLAMAINNLAQALQERGRLDEAIAHYHQALAIEPASARFHANLASVAADREDHAAAADRFELALTFDPENVPALVGLGDACHRLRLPAEARRRYERALELEPGASVAACGLADLELEAGDFAAAGGRLRALLDRVPDHAGALARLATVVRDRLQPDDLDRMLARVEDAAVPPAARANLHFALAQVLDSRGDFAGAAGHLDRANALDAAERRRRGRGYDPAAHARFVAALRGACSPAFFERVAGLGSASDRPIFVVGLPRSGTSLVEQILASHPRVHGAGELTLAREGFESLPRLMGVAAEPVAVLGRVDAAALGEVAAAHLDRLAQLDAGADRVVDKLPDNYLYLGFLAALFPRATFLHCRRDPRDVAVSCWMTDFGMIPWASDRDLIAGRFARYAELMRHWRATLPVPLVDVSYESLVADLPGAARRLIAACGLGWDDACLDFHRTDRPVRTASLAQVRSPVTGRSVGRWRHYEPALADLFAALPEIP